MKTAASTLINAGSTSRAFGRLRVHVAAAHECPPCGTALTAEHVARLADAVPPGTAIVIAFDADTAGRAAAEKSYQLLREWTGPVDVVTLPAAIDPADPVAHGRATAVQTMEAARRPLADLLVDQHLSRHRLDEIPGRLAALHAAAPLVADVAARDTGHAARLSAHLATRLDLNPLAVFSAIYHQRTAR